jgi:hypothetical protein
MGSGQSSPTVCDFSEEQILKLDQAIKKIKIDELIVDIKRNESYDRLIGNASATIPEVDGAAFASYMAALTGKSFEEKNEIYKLLNKDEYKGHFGLILNHLLYALVTDIFEEYKTILESIIGLCKKYKSTHVVEDVDEIDEIVLKNFSRAQTYFFLFNQIKIPVGISDKLKETIDIINKINERFSNIDELKSEMETIYKASREASSLFGRNGGSSRSRSSSKKRKQMKIKMTNSSNHLSKTRNNKQKYKKCKSVKK